LACSIDPGSELAQLVLQVDDAIEASPDARLSDIGAGGEREGVKQKDLLAESRVRKRSVRIGAHTFWPTLIGDPTHPNLSSAIRLLVREHYVRLANEATSSGKVRR
jgi:hypothetical protein